MGMNKVTFAPQWLFSLFCLAPMKSPIDLFPASSLFPAGGRRSKRQRGCLGLFHARTKQLPATLPLRGGGGFDEKHPTEFSANGRVSPRVCAISRHPSALRGACNRGPGRGGQASILPTVLSVILLAEVCYVFAPFDLALQSSLGPSQEALRFRFAVDHQGFT